MATIAATQTETRINFEVVWGEDEADRILYVDYGTGDFIDRTAEARANSKFLELIRHGVRVGFYRDGILVAGQEPIWTEEAEVAPAEHKTRTVLDAYQGQRYVTKSNGSCGRYVRGDTSVALCSCSWKYHAGSRAEARAAARVHRTESAAA